MSTRQQVIQELAQRLASTLAAHPQVQANPSLLDSLAREVGRLAVQQPQQEAATARQPPDETIDPDGSLEQLEEYHKSLLTAVPTSIPPRDRKGCVHGVAALKKECMSLGEKQMSCVLMGVPKPFSTTPLSELSRISFDEMLTPRTHKGSFLLARIISVAALTTAITVAVEDPTGGVQILCVYNFHLHGIQTGPDLDALFPLGQVLAIREPTARPNPNGGDTSIVIHAPSDLVFLQPNDPLLADVEWVFPSPAEPLPASFDYKAHGNSLFKSKKYLLAVKAYTGGLASPTSAEQKLLLHLNRSQAHLFLENFASAYRDASSVFTELDDDDTSSQQTKLKATLRRARALEGMRLLPDAAEAYGAVVDLDPSSPEGKVGKDRVDKMLEHAKTGVFDYRKVVKEEAAEKEKRVHRVNDVGDYVGPIKVVELKGRGGGRGVIATRDIAVGEVLLSMLLFPLEKAFAIASPVEEGGPRVVSYDVANRRWIRSNGSSLVKNIAARIMDDPSTKPIVYSLYGGVDYPPASLAALGALSDRNIEVDEMTDVDIARLEGIASQNAFGTHGPSFETRFGPNTPSALFLGASLFNHSCVPNAMHSIHGDLMFIRIRTSLSEGEELEIAYTTANDDLDKRNRIFVQHFGHACTCELCEADRQDGKENLERRQDLHKEPLIDVFAAFLRLDRRQLTEQVLRIIRQRLLSLTAQVEQTYTTSRFNRPDLVEFYCLLAELFVPYDDDCAKAIEYTLKSLRAGGTVIEVNSNKDKKEVKVVSLSFSDVPSAIGMLRNVSYALSRSRNPNKVAEAELWDEAAKEMSRLWDGGIEEFEKKYPRGWSLARKEPLITLDEVRPSTA